MNIFGGITRTTDVAEGIKSVLAEGGLQPTYARISGAEENEARKILEGTPVRLFSTAPDDMGLYGKPMARNAQIWSHDFQLLLDGLGQLGQLVQDLERLVGVVAAGEPLQLRPRRLEPREQLLGSRQ